MTIKTHDRDKHEMIQKLRLVKDTISKLIDKVETGLDWELGHTQLVFAITQLRLVNRQLAIHHLVVCIANRLRKQQSSVKSQRTISEFIKTFNYIN